MEDDFSGDSISYPVSGADLSLDSSLYSGDPSVSDYSYAPGNDNGGSLLGVDSGFTSSTPTGTAGSGNITINSGTGAATPTSPLTAISNGISSIGSSIGNVLRGLTGGQTATVYDAYGNPVGATSTIGTGLQNTAQTLTSGLTSFLPLILIGLVIWFVVRVFSKHSR